MRRSALKLGISLILIITIDALPKHPQRSVRSVDLNEWAKITSDCVCYNLLPRSYILEIEPLIHEVKFKGRVRINITWTDSADEISLHVHPDLQINRSNVRLTRLNDVKEDYDTSKEDVKAPAPVEITTIERDTRLLTIVLKKMLKRNTTCELDITYMGNITTNDTSGIFMNYYMDASGGKHTYVATYLRLHNARKMFPSFNDFSLKAKFQLVLTRPKNMTALSNTPIERSVPVPGDQELIQDHFEQTPEMATYQLAFVISDFASISPSKPVKPMDGRELQVRVWGRRDYLEALKDVPDRFVTIIDYLQDYFNSSIKMPKLEVIAMPMFTATKASDNWGLMIFKEGELSSPLVWNTAYELIYQWIGQYITPYHVMDAATSKGLNSFLAAMTTMDINPDELKGKWPMNILYSLYYGYGKTFGANRAVGIMRDAKSAKSELVFRMLYYILGHKEFKESMQHLIHTVGTGNGSQENDIRIFVEKQIFDSMDYVAKKHSLLPEQLTINKVANSWLDQSRLPLVTVTRNYDNNTISVCQKPYVRETYESLNSWESNFKWNIPLVMRSQNKGDDARFTAWLKETEVEKNFPDIDDKDSFVIVNVEEIGPYPVNYDSHNWQLLANYLQGPSFENIPTLTRAKLLHDSWNLAYADELCFKFAFNMTLFLKHETSHVVWEPFFTMIDHIGKRIEGSSVFTKFEAYSRSLLEPMYTEPCENPPAGEASWKTHLRGLARYFLCRAGYQPCIAEAREQFKKWMMDSEPDKGNPVANEFLCPVFKWGTDGEWNFALQRVINFPRNSLERKQSERTYLLKTLAGCPKDPAKIERLLNVSIIEGTGNFTDSDVHLIFTMLTGSANGYTTLFNFLNQHWDVIKQKLKDKPYLWIGIVNTATYFFKTQEGYDMVSKMYQERKDELGDAKNVLPTAIETIKQEMRWSEKNIPAIDEWLTENLSKPTVFDEKMLQYWKEALVCPKATSYSTFSTTTSSPLSSTATTAPAN